MRRVICPDCQAQTHVVESRSADEGAAVRRRRECTACGFRFTTFERVGTTRLQVVKRNGQRQPFDAEKLRGALSRAAHKRDVAAVQITRVVGAVEAEAAKRGGVIAAERIGELCLERLAAIDRGAYFQFAGTLPDITPEIGAFPETDSVRP
ncbi:MAG: transcriptional repressor NrdR [Solirubrobacterales bacterium]|jgi:transcriptional repressor NrdR|nr:transcriptional repressor NrdR [Solirubrobacterales bacterium]